MIGDTGFIRGLIVLLGAGMLTACDTIGYYAQGAKGHLQLMSQMQPLDEVLAANATKPRVKEQLLVARKARAYATRKLGLPDNDSYSRYADLKREHVTWNVIATGEFSMQPEKWCFPVTGCLSYRGYFKQQDAEQFASRLQAQGYETYIGGSTAYSTLGWFSDPIVSPMLRYGEVLLVETLFHELAHQQLYVKDDSLFNEAFATSVGEYGVRAWLNATQAEKLPAYERWIKRRNAFFQLLRDSADELKQLYAHPLQAAAMRKEKQRILDHLQTRYVTYKKQTHFDGFDNWFNKPVTNPRLAMVAVYHDRVPDFARWLHRCGDDFPRYYRMMAKLGALEKSARHTALTGNAYCD